MTYGNQSAVIEDVFVGTLPLPLAAVRAGTSEVRNALAAVGDEANQVRQALNSLADNLRQLQGGERPDWDKGTHAGNDAMALLTEPTIRLLLGLRRDPGRLEPGILAWELSVERIAWGVATPLLDSAPPSTFAGRVQKWGKEEHVVRLADVEAWFRTALAEALPGIKNQRIIERTAS